MKNILTILLIVNSLYISVTNAQGKLKDYQRAEKLLPENVKKLGYNIEIWPNWLEESDKFWYLKQKENGKEFILVDPINNTSIPAFDHEQLAKKLSKETSKKIDATNLPFDNFEYFQNQNKIKFSFDKKSWEYDIKEMLLSEHLQSNDRNKRNKLSSPDKKWIAFVKDYNLWIKSTENNEEIQLSKDGQEKYDYASPLPSIRHMVRQKTKIPDMYVAAKWSPDSKKILTFKIDHRKSHRYEWLQSVSPNDGLPQVYSSTYPLPGEINIPKAEPIIFDIKSKEIINIQTPPIEILYYGAPWIFNWTKDSKSIYFDQVERGYKAMLLKIADASTGITRTIIDERHGEHIHTWNISYKFLEDSDEILLKSERDGWNHLYLFDSKNGKIKYRLTEGEWVVRNILHVDEKNRIIYFSAGGKEQGRDPYLRYIYKINMDGTNLTLLTPEDADHNVEFSYSGKYFTDNFSKLNSIPETVLRSSKDGKIVRKLEKANIDKLLAMKYIWPEPFNLKARDDKTDIYGAIFKPTNFDPNKKYPIIDYIYAGPHKVQTPKRFRLSTYDIWCPQSLAELGFIVVTIDGLGTARRSKEFIDVSFKNLGDAGLPDHIKAIKELSEMYPYVNIESVGIFGHSAGGYSSTHAILAYPDFFKVAVSSAGNHILKLDKATWIERYMGFPVEDHFDEQSNATIAHQLKGKLFLIHGDLDDNVHPASTMILADSLIKANKDFDILIFPNKHHSIGYDPYFIRKRWDYFVKHLLGFEPPEYKINIEK